MARPRFSLTQIVALAVPFLLILLALPSAPYIERIIRTHVIIRSTTTTSVPTSPTTTVTTSTQPTATAVRGDTARTPVTTTTSPHSVRPTGATVQPAATAPATTTTTTTTQPAGPSGVLTETDAQAQVPVAGGTDWTLSTNGAVTWSLVCGATVTQPTAAGVQVPPDAQGCAIDLQTEQTTPVTWHLDEY